LRKDVRGRETEKPGFSNNYLCAVTRRCFFAKPAAGLKIAFIYVWVHKTGESRSEQTSSCDVISHSPFLTAKTYLTKSCHLLRGYIIWYFARLCSSDKLHVRYSG